MTANPSFFQVLTPYEGIWNGKHKIAATEDATVLFPGRCVKLDGDGNLVLCAAGDVPFGMLYGLHGENYDRLVHDSLLKHVTFNPSTYVTCIQDQFIAMVGAATFVGETLPDVGDPIYSAVSGMLDTVQSGSGPQLGIVTAVDTLRLGTTYGESQDVARVSFHIPTF